MSELLSTLQRVENLVKTNADLIKKLSTLRAKKRRITEDLIIKEFKDFFHVSNIKVEETAVSAPVSFSGAEYIRNQLKVKVGSLEVILAINSDSNDSWSDHSLSFNGLTQGKYIIARYLNATPSVGGGFRSAPNDALAKAKFELQQAENDHEYYKKELETTSEDQPYKLSIYLSKVPNSTISTRPNDSGKVQKTYTSIKELLLDKLP